MNEVISILGCGWLGLPLAEKLASSGKTVYGSTTSTAKLKLMKEKGIVPFLLNSKDLERDAYLKFLRDTDILIITLPPQSKEINKILADDIANSGIKKVLFVSSASVYPDINRPVKEEDAVYTKSPHSGRVLLELEDIFTNNSTFTATIVRFCGLFGPNRIPGKFMAGFKDLDGGYKPVNMIHLEDCVNILCRIIDRGVWGRVFNACSDRHPERREFYRKAAEKAGLNPPEFKSDPPEKEPYKIVDSERLKEELGYEFLHPDPLKAL